MAEVRKEINVLRGSARHPLGAESIPSKSLNVRSAVSVRLHNESCKIIMSGSKCLL